MSDKTVPLCIHHHSAKRCQYRLGSIRLFINQYFNTYYAVLQYLLRSTEGAVMCDETCGERCCCINLVMLIGALLFLKYVYLQAF